jgi:hypothetical protein
LYQGDGSHYFTYQENSCIIYDLCNTKGISWGDYNNNAPDLFIITFGGENYLYKNDLGENLSKVTEGPIATEVYNAYVSAWSDYDNDSCLDLFVANWGNDKKSARCMTL